MTVAEANRGHPIRSVEAGDTWDELAAAVIYLDRLVVVDEPDTWAHLIGDGLPVGGIDEA